MPAVNGIGLGLRMELGEEMLERVPAEVRWVEVHPENYIRRGGLFPSLLRRARERWPVVTHGLTMCFGAVEPVEREYMEPLRAFLHEVETPWHSDHMCFAGVDGVFAHDLLPLPFNESSLETLTRRITEARDFLDREIAFENVSYYAPSSASETDEASFTAALLERADCKMLLDVNNVYVNSRNHGFDPRAWIDRIPPERVVQLHVAGHFVRDDELRIDTHAEDVCDDVYELLDHTLRRMGPKPVLLERDGNFPPLDELLAQVRRLTAIYDRATAGD
jgi:hypothetical protein